MITPVGNAATSLALLGVSRAQEDFANAAVDVLGAYGAAANNISGAAPGGPSVDSQVFTAMATAEPAESLVNMLMAENAYKANMKVLETSFDMEKRVLDLLS